MKPARRLIFIVDKIAIWGIILGTFSGIVYGGVAFCFDFSLLSIPSEIDIGVIVFGGFIGGYWGFGLGFMFGLILGCIVAIVSVFGFTAKSTEKQYRRWITGFSAIATGLGTFCVSQVWTTFSPDSRFSWSLVAAILAALAAGYAGWRVARTYAKLVQTEGNVRGTMA